MKQIYLIIIGIALLSSSCMSSKKAIKNGNYDWAFNLAYNKARKNVDKDKRVLALEEAFNLIQIRDLERINELKKRNDPAAWDEIYNRYKAISNRQEKLKLLPDLVIKKEGHRLANLNLIDIDQGLKEAREQAAEYSYNSAVDLLNKGGRENARRAYYSLDHIKKFYSNYRDAENLKQIAHRNGVASIFIQTNPGYAVQVYPSINSELKNLDLAHLNNRWQYYHTNFDSSVSYDYTVQINIESIDYGPEQIKETRYSESKEVQDGWDYLLDENGNVLKDSLGNDIKTPRIIQIFCAVVETEQIKSTKVVGSMVLINNYNGQQVKTERIHAESVFHNMSAIAIGDIHALSEETFNKTQCSYVPFPSDFNMLKDASVVFNKISQDLIKKNDKYLM